MIKYIIPFLLLLSTSLLAKYYDNNVMTIEAKLFPKIALLEQSIKDSSSDKLEITIIANKDDFYAADIFKNKILSNYPKPIRDKQIIIDILTYKPSKMRNVDAIIVMSHKPKKLTEIASWANENHIVSFTYDYSNLKYGFLASIYIQKTTKPYLNKQTIIDYNFIFDGYFLQLSKINGI